MKTVGWALEQPSVERRRRAMKISSPAVVLAVAGRLAARADFGTGRNVAVSCATIAAELHLQPATVKRVTRFLRRLGFLVNVVTGANRLTLEQLWEAARRGAPNQRAVAATRALTIPGSVPHTVDGAPLPTPTHHTAVSHDQRNSPNGTLPRAAVAGAARRPRRRAKPASSGIERPVPLPDQKLAARLASSQHMPWLARSQHIGSLARALHRYGLAERGWTAAQILHRIELHAVDTHTLPLPLSQIRTPIAYLMCQIHNCISPTELSPARQSQLDAQARAHRQSAEQADAAELSQRIAAEKEQIDAIIAGMQLRHRARPS
ncbi:hypothetical protein MHK74_11565 [Microbacterium aurum]|uniref:hypothetical protein n=1 Tax=Microbacterium aurum TaxID=36805 RepID=UPI001EF428C5|nr:hypothetical protein [Microbacterium aurum]MCG7415194.1 hypothetical protein [Microbacterium aurum]